VNNSKKQKLDSPTAVVTIPQLPATTVDISTAPPTNPAPQTVGMSLIDSKYLSIFQKMQILQNQTTRINDSYNNQRSLALQNALYENMLLHGDSAGHK
jgi:hypothetical protein